MVGCVFDTAIVQVEAVNVDVGFHKPLNTETAVRRSRTRFAEATTGGYASIIARNSETVKPTFSILLELCLNPPSTSWTNSSGNRDQTRASRTCDTTTTATATHPAAPKSAGRTWEARPGRRRWRAGGRPLRR